MNPPPIFKDVVDLKDLNYFYDFVCLNDWVDLEDLGMLCDLNICGLLKFDDL